MVLPSTHFAAIFLLILGVCSWIAWIAVSKATVANWRFELYWLDVCIGLLVAAAVIAFTFGTLGSEMTFGDRWLVAGLRPKAWIVCGGVAFALGNMLFLAGLALNDRLSLLVTVLSALAITFTWVYQPHLGLVTPLFVLGLLLVASLGYTIAAVTSRNKAKKASAKARAISLLAGILLGGFYPLVRNGVYTDIGVGAYGSLLLLAVTALLSTAIFSIYFFNLPVNGPPVGLMAYRLGSLQKHLAGLLAGFLYAVAIITLFLGLSVGA